jgi:hypothetical protein
MSRKQFLCIDCGIDTGKYGELYFLKPYIWYHINPLINGMLCVGCAELRLGRQFTPADFTPATINALHYGNKSMRLISRLLPS